ncbi:hypothetical protein EJ05DRAFT_484652 [Pseudovirgaria hyperparasitica]|uniref:Uncharacterized protein n=1 Tax=Pseudovirgaria hyperparasitica TaxID=470096 RepID=A0A6A6WDU9_9PEZI|nr:uncharacterized protein EJ05DRAFT_484652 [Pseudovirgaria hyperparasitica]KAF2759737.1 hypothetical protein EJ05DRAFT_484652 [Pseudovirgaria hyperparasitica]
MANPNSTEGDDRFEYDDLCADRRENTIARDYDHRYVNDPSVGFVPSRASSAIRGGRAKRVDRAVNQGVTEWNTYVPADEERDHTAESLGVIHGGQLHRIRRDGYTEPRSLPPNASRPIASNTNKGPPVHHRNIDLARASPVHQPARTASSTVATQTPQGPKLFNPERAMEMLKTKSGPSLHSAHQAALPHRPKGPSDPSSRGGASSSSRKSMPLSASSSSRKSIPPSASISYVVDPTARPTTRMSHPYASDRKTVQTNFPDHGARPIAYGVDRYVSDGVTDKPLPAVTNSSISKDEGVRYEKLEPIDPKDPNAPAPLAPVKKPIAEIEALNKALDATASEVVPLSAEHVNDWFGIVRDTADIKEMLTHGVNYHIDCRLTNCPFEKVPCQIQAHYRIALAKVHKQMSVGIEEKIAKASLVSQARASQKAPTGRSGVLGGGLDASRYAR